MKGRAVCQQKGKGSLRHNNRDFIANNVDPDRIKDNIILKKESLQAAYDHCFGWAMKEYNDNQKRSDRKIDDYFKHLFGVSADSTLASSVIQSKDKTKSFYEDIVQIGDLYDTGIKNNPETAEKAKNALIEYFEGFSKRNEQFHVFNAVIHMDEATPHLHIDYIPIAYGYSRGMSVQNGYNKALEQMGYRNDRESTGFQKWREHERDVFREICTRYGLNPKSKEDECSRGHTYTPEQYRELIHEAEATKAKADKKLEIANEKINECNEFVIKCNKRVDKIKEKEAALADKENELNERKKALDLRELHIEEEITNRVNARLAIQNQAENAFKQNSYREIPDVSNHL